MKIVKLTSKYGDIVENFHSGNSFIDYFINSGMAIKCLDPVTYILIEDDYIIGYYSLSVNSLDIYDNGKFVRQGGSVHIDKFAIDKKFQGDTISIYNEEKYYFSDYLLSDCISRAFKLREQLGISFITLSSTESGLSLYKRNNFELLEDDMLFSINSKDIDCINMYLALDIE